MLAEARVVRTLQDAAEGWIAERDSERGLKRSTTQDYVDLFERLYRDLGADTPVLALSDGRLKRYFASFEAQRILGQAAAERARQAGGVVREIVVERWTARPPGSEPVEVETKAAAERLASELGGTWKHRRRGAYRVVPANSQRPHRVSRAEAERLKAQGWIVKRRAVPRLFLCTPAAPQTRNKYRDLLSAILDYACRERWMPSNPLREVKRSSRRGDRERILRRDDFYDPDDVQRLLEHSPGEFEEAFWLCGFHAGMRLPGEALGLRWGAIDFETDTIRVYDNWVRNALDGTKTSDSAPVPMTPQLRAGLLRLMKRGYRTGDDDHVFTRDELGQPAADRQLRDSFRAAQAAAGLKPIRMYNARHSFGTGLARSGVDVRTIQALMRHARLSTTEQYMAYAPQPDLAKRVSAALSPTAERSTRAVDQVVDLAGLLEKLDEEVPAKWAREVRRLLAETGQADQAPVPELA